MLFTVFCILPVEQIACNKNEKNMRLSGTRRAGSCIASSRIEQLDPELTRSAVCRPSRFARLIITGLQTENSALNNWCRGKSRIPMLVEPWSHGLILPFSTTRTCERAGLGTPHGVEGLLTPPHSSLSTVLRETLGVA